MIIDVISTVLCVVCVDILQHIGCCDSAVVDDNVDVTVTVVSVADDGHVTVSVHRYLSLPCTRTSSCACGIGYCRNYFNSELILAEKFAFL